MRVAALLIVFWIGLSASVRAALPSHRIELVPGSPEEKSYLSQEQSSSVREGMRVAEAPGFWVYHLSLPPGGEAQLSLSVEGSYEIALSSDGASYRPAALSARKGEASLDLSPLLRRGPHVYIRILARSGEIRLKQATLVFQDKDSNSDGVGDIVERLMGFDPASLVDARPPKADAHISFRADSPYGEQARMPSLYRGEVAERAFETAFLEYSSLVNRVRGTDRKLWLSLDMVEDSRRNFERVLIAALMFPQASRYEVISGPEHLFERLPSPDATRFSIILNALEEMRRQPGARWESGSQGIATFADDRLVSRKEAPNPDDPDSFWGLTLPLLMNGLPVEAARLERAAEPGYLDPYRVLLLSYDALKPLDERIHEALAEWVRRGGFLVFFGGAGPYNDLSASWWKTKGYKSPQEDLFARLGVHVSGSSTLVGESGQDTYRVQLKADQPYRSLENRRNYSIDLTPYLGGDPSPESSDRTTVYIRFQDAFPQDGWGAWVRRLYLDLDGRLGVAFLVGTQFEKRFLFEDGGSGFEEDARTADRDSYIVYKFDIPRTVRTAFLTVEMGNQFLVKVSGRSQTAYRELARVGSHLLGNLLPAIQVGKRFPITAYDTSTQKLYSLPDSSFAPVFEAKAGRGRLLVAGIPPRFFARSDAASRAMRAIVRYAYAQTGAAYREQPFLRLDRGRYIIVRTFDRAIKVPGPVIDLLDPGLPVLVSREIPKDSLALLYDARAFEGPDPELMYCSSPVEKKKTDRDRTALFITGPPKTGGIARLHTGGRTLKQAEAFDCIGAPVPVEPAADADTLALRYENLPGGVVLRLKWGG